MSRQSGRATDPRKVGTTAMPAPRVLVIIFVDGKEIAKKPVRADTLQGVQEEAVRVCPQIANLHVERLLVYDRGFDEYIDDDEHIPTDNDKIHLHLTTKAPPMAGAFASIASIPVGAVTGLIEQAFTSAQVDNACHNQEQSGETTGKVARRKVVKKPQAPVSVPTSSADDPLPLEDEDLLERSRIFGKSGKPLTMYQQHINAATFQLARSEPTLLLNRGLLLERARQHLHASGYEYVRGGKSRSKVFGGHGGEKTQSKPAVYTTESKRADRIDEITEQMESIKSQIQFLAKAKEAALAASQFGDAATFEQQSAELKQKLRKLRTEKKDIIEKSKALRIRKRKRNSKGSGKSGVHVASPKMSKLASETEPVGETSNAKEENNGEFADESSTEVVTFYFEKQQVD